MSKRHACDWARPPMYVCAPKSRVVALSVIFYSRHQSTVSKIQSTVVIKHVMLSNLFPKLNKLIVKLKVIKIKVNGRFSHFEWEWGYGGFCFVVVEARYYFSLVVFWVKMAAPVELKYEKLRNHWWRQRERDRSSLSLSLSLLKENTRKTPLRSVVTQTRSPTGRL